MRFEFEKVVRKVELGEYIPELEGKTIPVWVNIPRDLLQRMLAIKKDTPKDEIFVILQELWGESDWPMEDIQALFDHCMNNDMQLWVWITKQTFDLVYNYRLGQKKE
jgi:hypothetical protein